MQHYAVVGYDAPGAASIRAELIKEHLRHVEAAMDRLAVAGPLRDEAGAFIGSLLIVEAPDEAGARAIIEADPYFNAGVWSRIEISLFGAVAGRWVGGKTW